MISSLQGSQPTYKHAAAEAAITLGALLAAGGLGKKAIAAAVVANGVANTFLNTLSDKKPGTMLQDHSVVTSLKDPTGVAAKLAILALTLGVAKAVSGKSLKELGKSAGFEALASALHMHFSSQAYITKCDKAIQEHDVVVREESNEIVAKVLHNKLPSSKHDLGSKEETAHVQGLQNEILTAIADEYLKDAQFAGFEMVTRKPGQLNEELGQTVTPQMLVAAFKLRLIASLPKAGRRDIAFAEIKADDEGGLSQDQIKVLPQAVTDEFVNANANLVVPPKQ